jgi:uncharacterized membrane protein YfcA
MAGDLSTVMVVAAVFLVAGAVKGVVGLGLPTVSLALLTVVFDLATAMTLLLVPSFVTNCWQALVGGNGRAILRRLWPFLTLATVTVWLGAQALTRLEPFLLKGLLGLLLVLYALVNLVGFRPAISRRQESWLGPLLGTVNGILTGMTGSFVVPGVMFLQAIGLPRDQFIQAMGMLFTVSTVALGLSLGQASLLGCGEAILSAGAALPAVVGMIAGQALRRHLSEQRFRTVFFVALLMLGLYIVIHALVAR